MVLSNLRELETHKLHSQIFLHGLLNSDLGVECPELYFYLKGYKFEIKALFDIMFTQTFRDTDTNQEYYLNYLSIDSLTELISINLGKKVTKEKVWVILNILTVTEIISKLQENDIPLKLYNDIVVRQKYQSSQIRVSNFYLPSDLSIPSLENSYSIAKTLKENQVSLSSLSYETVYRIFGEEKAKKDFPQAYIPLVDNNLITMSRQNINLPKHTVDFEKRIVKLLLKEIDKNGYIYEKDLLIKMSRKLKKPLSTIRVRFSKMRMTILSQNNLDMQPVNQSLLSELPFVVPKNKIKYRANIIFLKQ